MKKLEAIFKPHKLEDVEAALQEMGIEEPEFEDAMGVGRQDGRVPLSEDHEYQVRLLPKVKLTLILDDEQVEPVVAAIRKAALTGHIGDGKIFLSSVDEAPEMSFSGRLLDNSLA
ncbi:MAG TPA: P-II family nitrogen regulator [Alphaproteobacteria bacterium]|nr:P-II family nitrogen regulator [Alphaproteobacteria bacterium]